MIKLLEQMFIYRSKHGARKKLGTVNNVTIEQGKLVIVVISTIQVSYNSPIFYTFSRFYSIK